MQVDDKIRELVEKAIKCTTDNTILKEIYTLLTAQAEQIKELEGENHWIPVSERLPEVGQHILVFWKGSVVGCTDSVEACNWDGDWPDETSIIYWKPIILPDQALQKGEAE